MELNHTSFNHDDRFVEENEMRRRSSGGDRPGYKRGRGATPEYTRLMTCEVYLFL